MNTNRELVEAFASRHGVLAEWEGEIGFGREAVGLLDASRGTWIGYRYDGGCDPGNLAPDAFDKSNYIAVIGRGDSAESQLAAWVARLNFVDVSFLYLPKEVPDLSTLVRGYHDELCAVRRV